MDDRKPAADAERTVDPPLPPVQPHVSHGVMYPNLYVWFVFLASLDIMCTYLIMHPTLFPGAPTRLPPPGTAIPEEALLAPRGREVNPIADWIIDRGGVPGKVAYKFSLVLFVIGSCEIIGRRRFRTGKRLAEWAVALNAVPVVFAIYQMTRDTLGNGPAP